MVLIGQKWWNDGFNIRGNIINGKRYFRKHWQTMQSASGVYLMPVTYLILVEERTMDMSLPFLLPKTWDAVSDPETRKEFIFIEDVGIREDPIQFDANNVRQWWRPTMPHALHCAGTHQGPGHEVGEEWTLKGTYRFVRYLWMVGQYLDAWVMGPVNTFMQQYSR